MTKVSIPKSPDALTISLLLLLQWPGILPAQIEIFEQDVAHVFAVQYTEGGTATNDTITLTATGNAWRSDPETQKELIIGYKLDQLDTARFSDISNIGWVGTDTTGYVDGENSCWFHPPRHNQYKILELAPFPRVEYPLESERSYVRMLFIGGGWGEMSHTKVMWTYWIINETNGWWHIAAEAKPEISADKINTLDFSFHPRKGFDNLKYAFSNGTRVTMNRIK